MTKNTKEKLELVTAGDDYASPNPVCAYSEVSLTEFN